MPAHREKHASSRDWLLPLMTLGLILGVVLGRNARTWYLPAAALTSALAAALILPGRRRVAALVLAAASLGVLVTYHANHPELPDEGQYTVTGVIVDEILLTPVDADSIHLTTTLDNVTLNGKPCRGKVRWTAYTTPDKPFPEWLSPGAHISFTARVYHPSGASNPGGYDDRVSLLAGGIRIGIYGMKEANLSPGSAGLTGQMAALRHTLTLELQRVMGEKAGGLAAAMLLGARDYVSEEDYAAFRQLGVSHILSVSGYHVSILAMMLAALLYPIHLPVKLRTVLLVALLALYAMFTGAAPPVIRAGLLVFLRESGKNRHNRNLPIHLLCLAAACQLLMNPMQLFGPSFQLTYSAMLGLVLVYPRLRDLQVFSRPWMNWSWQGFSASAAVQLGLLPAQMYWFGGIPLISLPLNMFIIAFSGCLMGLYWLTLALLPIPGLREAAGFASGLITRSILFLLRALAGVAGSNLWTPAANALTLLGWASLLIGLSILIRRDRGLLRRTLSVGGALLIILSMVRLPHTGTYLIQFSDGEADAALLHDRNAVILVDTGENAYTAADYLCSRRLSVDALIITHLHADHAGGIAGLLELGVPVQRCYVPEGADLAADCDPIVAELLAALAETGTEIIPLARGDVLYTPSGRLTVLWPQHGAVRPGQGANDTCLVLRAEIMGTTMLLAADLTSRYEMYAAIPADILKAAHHGSAESTSPEFLSAVRPQLILLSCGTEDREAAFLPRAGDIPVCSTNTSGAVTIRFTENAFTVETYLPR